MGRSSNHIRARRRGSARSRTLRPIPASNDRPRGPRHSRRCRSAACVSRETRLPAIRRDSLVCRAVAGIRITGHEAKPAATGFIPHARGPGRDRLHPGRRTSFASGPSAASGSCTLTRESTRPPASGSSRATGFWTSTRRVIAYAPPGFPVPGRARLFRAWRRRPARQFWSRSSRELSPSRQSPGSRDALSAAGPGGRPRPSRPFPALTSPSLAWRSPTQRFLLFWLLALIAGQRFLERPTASRAFVLGLAVGVAQLFKYNGWLAGAIVVLTASHLAGAKSPRVAVPSRRSPPGDGASSRRSSRPPSTGHGSPSSNLTADTARSWPISAAISAAFVPWPDHLMAQLAQSRALSGGPVWLVSSGLAAAFAMTAIRHGAAGEWRSLPRFLLPMLSLSAFCLLPNLAWWVPLAWLPGLVPRDRYGRPRPRDLPLRRLADPLGADAVLPPLCAAVATASRPSVGYSWAECSPASARDLTRAVAGSDGKSSRRSVPIAPGHSSRSRGNRVRGDLSSASLQTNRLPGLLAPSDSLRSACASIAHDLPKDVKTLRVFARPPVTFYLGQFARVSLDRQPSLSELFEPSDAATWALLDMAIVRQDQGLEAELKRSSSAWVLVRAIPSTLEFARASRYRSVGRNERKRRRRGRAPFISPETGRGPSMSPTPPVSLWPNPDALGMLTDLYELTMMAGYHASGMAGQKASFELFVRKLPEGRAFLVFAGLEQAIGDLLKLAFDPRADRRNSPLAGISQCRSQRDGQTRRHAIRGRCLRRARGNGRLRGGDACCEWKPRCRRPSGSKRICSTRSPIQPWSLPRPPESSPPQAENRSTNSVPAADTDHSPA